MSDTVTNGHNKSTLPNGTANGTGPTDQAAQDAFTAHYMSKVAAEFAEDLDKIRSARDFKDESSLAILLDALRQGTKGFALAEQVRIGRGLAVGT